MAIQREIIETELRASTSQAQAEYAKVEISTGNLIDKNKQLKLSMAKLEAEGKKQSDSYKKLNTLYKQNNQTISQNRAQMKLLQKQLGVTSLTANQLRKRANELKRELNNMSKEANPTRWNSLNKELMEVQKQQARVTAGATNLKGGMGLLKQALPIVGFAALAAAGKRLVSNIIDVRKEFQRYQAVLSTALGSEKEARIEMNNIKNLASQTPFSVNQLTDSYVKLVNQGFKPSTEEMIKMGDLASSTGKGFDQLTEAIIDAQTGEFERLKEFGIRAKKEGDKVTFTFKGIEQQVDFTSDSIREYILGLGESEGVTGSMTKISETLGGQISNLGDNWTQLLDNLGNRSGGVFYTVINWLNKMIEGLSLASKSIEQIKLEVADDQWVQTLKDDQEEIKKTGEAFIKTLNIQLEARKKELESGQKNFAQLQLERDFYGKAKSAAIELSEEEKERLKGEIELMQARVAEANRYLFKIQEQKTKTVILTKEQKKALEQAKKAREKVIQDLNKLEDDYYNSQLDRNDKEINDLQQKYDKIYDEAVKANSNQAILDKINAQYAEELAALLADQDKRAKDEAQKKEEEHQNKILQIREKYQLMGINELQQIELDNLQKAYDQKLISEEEFQQAKQYIVQKYNDLANEKDREAREKKLNDIREYYAQVDALASAATDLFIVSQDAELDKLKSTYDKKIKAAGNNSAQKEKLEQELAAKEKAIKKKQADAEFIITTAQIIANTALAVAKVWGQTGLGGAIAQAAPIAMGLLQIATANKQRQIAAQAKRGRYPVIGAEDGRTYYADYYGTPTSGILNHGRPTIINEQGGEYIMNAAHTRNIATINPNLFNIIDSYRVPQRAEGNYPVTQQPQQPNNSEIMARLENNTKAINNLNAILSQGIRGVWVYSDLKDVEDDYNDARNYAAGN